LPDRHHVLGPGVAVHRVQALGLGDGAGLDQSLDQPLGGFLDGAGTQRHDDVLGAQDVLELHTRSRNSGTTSAGRFITEMPARANAAIFSAAVPAEPEIIAPAWPMRRAGGAVWPAMKPITGLGIPCCTNSAACCSSLPPISPITNAAAAPGPAWTADRLRLKCVPITGSPPTATEGDW